MSAYNDRTRNRSGLTTLDIIIVLVVLVVLAAVLFPIFARPTCIGTRKSTCQNNLKDCAIALQTYWADYDNTLPSSAVVSHSKTWNRRDFVRFASRLGEMPPDPKRQSATWPQLLYNAHKGWDICFCTSDSADHRDPNSRVSYYWKAAIDKAWYGVGCKKPCRKEADFAWSADQIVFYERCGFHSDAENGLRNGVRINVAYLDTHVKSVTLTNSLTADGDRWVTSPTASGEPAYFNFDNSKVKGQGNPPNEDVRTTYTDPNRYSDSLP